MENDPQAFCGQSYDMLDYLFDLRGYVILKNAVDADHLAALNSSMDGLAAANLRKGEWLGNVQLMSEGSADIGSEFHNVIEGGKPFEDLIDHPSWIDRILSYCGEKDTYVHGLFIDECFASIRKSGGYFPMHSGGQTGTVRNQFRVVNGKFRCGQVNVLLAVTGIGPGDGGTRVVAGSHKSNFAHPVFRVPIKERLAAGVEHVEGETEVHLKAGDALIFVDAISHGATERTNPGERRVVIYRYGPSWGSTRYGFRYSDALLTRLTPARRKILQPVEPRTPGVAGSGSLFG